MRYAGFPYSAPSPQGRFSRDQRRFWVQSLAGAVQRIVRGESEAGEAVVEAAGGDEAMELTGRSGRIRFGVLFNEAIRHPESYSKMLDKLRASCSIRC